MSSNTPTTRVPGTLHDELHLIARVDGLTSSGAIRLAIENHITDREAGRGLPESLYIEPLDQAVTARLPDHLVDELHRLALADDVTPSAVTREAIRKYVAARKADPTFYPRLISALRRDLNLARAMAPSTAPADDLAPAGGNPPPVSA